MRMIATPRTLAATLAVGAALLGGCPSGPPVETIEENAALKEYLDRQHAQLGGIDDAIRAFGRGGRSPAITPQPSVDLSALDGWNRDRNPGAVAAAQAAMAPPPEPAPPVDGAGAEPALGAALPSGSAPPADVVP
jgi:hypothetical protein